MRLLLRLWLWNWPVLRQYLAVLLLYVGGVEVALVVMAWQGWL